ncbi:MAG: universal stress protein [Pseudomonadota bacterium]
MIPTIKRVLYATDLSENAKFAFAYAADLAQRYDAKLTILSVLETLSPYTEGLIQEMMGLDDWNRLKSEHQENSKEKIKQRITDFCQEMDTKIESCNFIADDIQVTKGIPHREILRVAKEVCADMIVMGTYGHNILQDSLIGGTTRRIVKDSTIPVLVIRLPEDD